MKKINLSGKWELKNCTDNRTCEATLPGSNFGNLIKNKVIVNPLISGKEEEALETAKHDYEFTRTVVLDKEAMQYDNISIMLDIVDTLCTCYINGKKAFYSENAYIPVNKSIKEFLNEGENTFTFHFHSDYEYIKKMHKEDSTGANNNGVNGIPHIRKPGCEFGWDWGPCVPYCGIIGNMELQCYSRRIEAIRISQDTTKEKSTVKFSAKNTDKVYMITPDGKKISPDGDTFTIEKPELWYTKEMSEKDEQPLYTVVFENDEDKIEKEIGLRSLYLDRGADEYGENFCFVLNGEKVFAKGANLIPFSAMPEDSNDEIVNYYLDLCEDCNFNMLRVWGGGAYATEHLMNECDRRGILIWQDFCYACQMYPFHRADFLANAIEEAKANVLRLNTHPSLALWCGNNEIEFMYSYLPNSNKLMIEYEKFFYHTLPDAIKDLTDTSYIPTSPIGSKFRKKNSADAYGDTHMWNVWHGLKKLDYYQQRYSRFLSEFGLESLPSMKAIKTFAKPDEYNITSESFNNHQKCIGGNEKMMFYLTEMFDEPEDFEALPYLTGIVQAECIKNATVHFRQNKGRCNGSLFWQLNDVWNCPSWSSVDFEGVPKALQYKAKEFFEPVTVTCKKENGTAFVYAHNDTLTEKELKIEIEIYDFFSNRISKKDFDIKLAPNSYKKVDEFETSVKTFMRINYNGKKLTEIFDAPCNIPFEKANVTARIIGSKAEITTDRFAYNVCIECDETPSENYFCLKKGEVKTVEFKNAPKEIKLMCVNNLEFKGSKLKKNMFRFTYRLKPLNIGNYVYYSVN